MGVVFRLQRVLEQLAPYRAMGRVVSMAHVISKSDGSLGEGLRSAEVVEQITNTNPGTSRPEHDAVQKTGELTVVFLPYGPCA